MNTRILMAALFILPNLCWAQRSKSDVLKNIEEKADFYTTIAQKIWDYAEVGFQETQSSALLLTTLANAGFKIESGVADMPTAFIASYGSGKPVIGILGEYDALPGMSQEAVPNQKPIAGQQAGHACGHHLFGTASAAAAIAVKNWLVSNRKTGTIRFYGTPAEEGGSGKVYMVRTGLFNDVDAVLHWHPSATNSAAMSSSLSNKSGKFRFYGISSHAAAAPERGRSALDGVEAMNNMVNMMREHVSSDSRIHYVITRGGEAPNVVPAFAEVYYYIRNPQPAEVKNIWERLVKAAQGAALGTETKVEYEVTGGVYNILPNEQLAKLVYTNLKQLGGFTYTETEKQFAEKIQSTFKQPPSLSIVNDIAPFEMKTGMGGSTDVGDISWIVPTAGLTTATWVPGTAAHSWQAVAVGGTSFAAKGMLLAAKTMALTAIDLFEKPAVIMQAGNELRQKRGDQFRYEALVGDRKPALDYRK